MAQQRLRRRPPTNAYRRLISNIFLFFVSTFGSRILIFLLTPFYTSILSESEYGVTDILIQTGNFLIPLFSAGIVNSVLRFGLDDQADKACIFTTGLTDIVTGECFLVLFYPLLQNIWIAEDYTILLLLYVLMASLHSICSSMAQTLGRVRLYAVSGILCTTLVVGLNILLLVRVSAWYHWLRPFQCVFRLCDWLLYRRFYSDGCFQTDYAVFGCSRLF